MKNISIDISHKELEILQSTVRYHIETIASYVSDGAGKEHADDIQWKASDIFYLANILSKMHHQSVASKRKKGKK